MKYNKLSKPTQRHPLNSRQVKNSAGGYVYQISDAERLMRFLILGSDQPTYYASARKMTLDNVRVIQDLWQKDPETTANTISAVSSAGRAPKNDPAIFALALGACIPEASRYALSVLPGVCRTASHLFSFLSAVEGNRGWGRGLRRAVAEWYEKRPAEKLAYQMIKYRQRDGFTHKRAIELSHPRVNRDEAKGTLLRYSRGKDVDYEKLPELYGAFIRAQSCVGSSLIKLIEDYRLPWEAVPTEALKDKRVVAALIPHMPLGALLRHLGIWSYTGLLTRERLSPLVDPQALAKARIHPYAMLTALATYQSGQGARSSWTPLRQVIEVLDEGFYAAFEGIEPAGKRILIGLDVSGSMGWNHIQGGLMTARAASAAMCMVTIASEPCAETVAFSHELTPLHLHKRMSIKEVVDTVTDLPFGNTDCALPMVEARRNKWDFDAFVIYTDNETWYGSTHPTVALKNYRQFIGKDVKLIVVGMTSTGFTIADPASDSMLDVVGFDTAAPSLISNFIAGRV